MSTHTGVAITMLERHYPKSLLLHFNLDWRSYLAYSRGMLRQLSILATSTLGSTILASLVAVCLTPVSVAGQTKRIDPFVQAERDAEAARRAGRHDRAERIEELEQRQRQHELVSPLADDHEAKETEEQELD